jgi:beta-N-acetylhexosaminidase
MPRSQAVPACIASGADMFLFSRDMEEDFYYMRKGLEDGILTVERIDEAVTRTLALKAKINLHARKAEGTLIPSVEALDIFKKPDGEQMAKEIADKGITLVKDTQKLLPFTSAEKKNVYLIALGDEGGYHNPRGGYVNRFKVKLEEKGFNVTLFNRETPNEPINFAKEKIEELKKKIDVVIYFGNIQTNGSDSAARISWPGLRITLPLLNKDIPTMLVSIDNPYLLIDAPRMATYINAYTSEDIVVDAVVEKIVGESPFKGVSPIDPFAGIFGATL